MKKILVATVASLSLLVQAVAAEPRYGHRHAESHHGDRASVWAGVAAIGALVGLAIFADNARSAEAPEVVAATSGPLPTNVPPPSAVWYYCASSAMYYPDTQACPEGWRTVRAAPSW